MTYLSSNQLKQYEDQGYISPIEVLSSSEALEAREEIELIEKKMPNEVDKSGRYNDHLISQNYQMNHLKLTTKNSYFPPEHQL